MLYMADAYMGKAHVTADQIGDYNAGVSGSGCVLNVGEKLRAEIINANLVRIYDGAFIFQGYRRSGITAGSYEDVTIENGTQAQKRNDLICAKYEKDSTTSKENLTLVVIKGTPGDTASDPEIPEGDVRSGSAVCYMPLYRVRLDGINLAAVEKLFTVRKTMKEIEDDVTALNNNLQTKSLTLDLTYGRLKLIKQLGIVHVITLSMIYISEGLAAHGIIDLGNIADADFWPSESACITSLNLSGGKYYPGVLLISSNGTVSIINTSEIESNMYGQVNGFYTTLS